jgi:outer membrane protein TolC
MNGFKRVRWWLIGLALVSFSTELRAQQTSVPVGPNLVFEQKPSQEEQLPQPRLDLDKSTKRPRRTEAQILAELPQPAPSILPKEMNAIDLSCALRLAGVDNPDILIARQRVARAQALRFFALTFVLPNINVGGNYDDHNGPLQQSSGNILKVNRQALNFGLGAGAIAAGTVGIPGVWYTLNFADGIFNYLAIRYNLRARQADSLAVRNEMLLRTTTAYMNLVRAESHRSIAVQNQLEAREIARVTAAQADVGAGTQADADRTAAELALRNDDVVRAEQEMLVASARLAQLLNIPPSAQLHAIDGWVVPTEVVPNVIPLHELLFIAINQRPELAARRFEIREALMRVRNQIYLPLSPTVLAGYSTDAFGGGSNLVAAPQGFQGFQQPYFGNFAPRQDVDVIMFWTAQNFGVGNLARVRLARTEQRIAELELVRTLNRVRDEVATAYARTHAHYAQIDIARREIVAATGSLKEDYNRIKNTIQGALGIELLNSFRLLATGRLDYLDAIVEYDKAQFALYVALGQPPTQNLAHEIPANLAPPPKPAPPLPSCVAAGCAPPAIDIPPGTPAPPVTNNPPIIYPELYTGQKRQ